MVTLDPTSVSLLVPLGVRDFFPPPSPGQLWSYEAILRDLGMEYDTFVEYALLVWPRYTECVDQQRPDHFYDHLMSILGDDIGPQNLSPDQLPYHQALSMHADALTRLVANIDSQLSHWFGHDLFYRDSAPESVTLRQLWHDRIALIFHYRHPTGLGAPVMSSLGLLV